MRRRFTGRRFARASFRRRPRVTWLTDPALQGERELLVAPTTSSPTPDYHLITRPDNDFVETHPRFARANDLMGLRRLLGFLRVAMYLEDGVASWAGNEFDVLVKYGILIVKGDYDPAGVWTQTDTTSPDEKSDEDDKWLFKNTVILSPGANYSVLKLVEQTGTSGSLSTTTNAPTAPLAWQPTRSAILSTDFQLPNGSHIDLKTRRKLEYGERLVITATAQGDMPEGLARVFINYDLRLLVRRVFG